jgi:hypothetical protein
MMGLKMERMLKQATLLDPIPKKVQEADLLDIERYQRAYWGKMGAELRESEDPTAMAESLYAALGALPPATQISTTSVNGEVGIWSAATHSPLPANGYMAPAAIRLAAAGQCTTSTSPGNATWTPRLGTTTGGGALGASGAIAMTASITNSFWLLTGDVTVRTIGPGTSASAIATFLLHHRHAIAGAGDFITTTSSGTGQQIFGNTVATFDSTAAQGLFMGMAMTVTNVTWKVDQVHWAPLN